MERRTSDTDSNDLDERTETIQRVLGSNDREAAASAARDLLSPGMRKPASDDVENERIARARSEATDGAILDADDPKLRPAIERADEIPL